MALAFHHHQPPGNLPESVERAYSRSYLPIIEALERHAHARALLHYSGSLIEWLRDQRPGFLERVRALASAGRVEILGGAMYEPILASIPRADQLGQIRAHAAACEAAFGRRPRGLWLAERVWEPELAAVLADAGVVYTLLDDTTFLGAGVGPADMGGYFVTEDQGRLLRAFPISRALRNLVPLRPVEEVLTHLRGLRDGPRPALTVFADAGEKFRGGWLDEFLGAAGREGGWLRTTTLSAHLEWCAPRGRAYLPSGSYLEMGTWALPAEAALTLSSLRALFEVSGELGRFEPFLRGGHWRNFLVRYPEANHLHHRAAYVSHKVHAAPRAPEEAARHLWRAQTGAPYWHGQSGGIYLNFLRSAAYANLIRAENEIEPRKYAWLEIEHRDLDLDGVEEVIAESHTMNVYFGPAQGGAITELDYRPKAFNLLDTLARRPESYHPAPGETGLDLVYDRYPRRGMIDHFVGAESTLEEFQGGTLLELGDFATGRFESGKYRDRVTLTRRGSVRGPVGEPVPVELRKAVRILPKACTLEVEYRITNRGPVDVITRFGSEWAFGFLAGDAPDRYYVVDGRRAGSLGSAGEDHAVQSVRLVDDWLGLEVELAFEGREVLLWRHPLETVSRGDDGRPARQYQASVVLPLWDLDLPAGRSRRVAYSLRVRER